MSRAPFVSSSTQEEAPASRLRRARDLSARLYCLKALMDAERDGRLEPRLSCQVAPAADASRHIGLH